MYLSSASDNTTCVSCVNVWRADKCIDSNSTEPVIISLTSSPSSSVMAGDTVTLTCSATLPTGVTGTPDFHWEGPGVTPTPADPTTNRQEVSSVLTLSTISTSQAGQYICTATLNGSSVTNITTVTVQSELLCHFTVPCTLNTPFLSPSPHSIHHCHWYCHCWDYPQYDM